MSNTHVHVPQLQSLIEELEKTNLIDFIDRYRKYEYLIGPSESIKFLEDKFEEYKKIKK
jgi:hypothetical protein